MDWIEPFLAYFGSEEGERAINGLLAVLGAIAAFCLWFFGVLGKLWTALRAKPDKPEPASPSYSMQDSARTGFSEASAGGIATGQVQGDVTINQGVSAGEIRLTLDQFTDQLKKARDEARAELPKANVDELVPLKNKIAELERQLANPDDALVKARKTIADLETRLQREANGFDTEQVEAATNALRAGDYSIADKIFAEIEMHVDLEIQQGARAAFGRGEVAEAELRWSDAARHYARAARLGEDFDAVIKACEFADLSGDFETATRFAVDCVRLAKSSKDEGDLSDALGRHASVLWRTGQSSAAEPLCREALEIKRRTTGEQHQDYADRLNMLGVVVQAQGRFAEAEALFREALGIGSATIGEKHSDYAIWLNNLAHVIQSQGRFSEAEQLYRETLETGKATIGETHPDYATRLNNLAAVVESQGRLEEAEQLYRDALAIGRASIGEEHPDYAIWLNNLAHVLHAQQRFEESEQHLHQALEIDRATIGENNPEYATHLSNLGRLQAATDRSEEARETFQKALQIFERTLPGDHPNLQHVRNRLSVLDADD